MGVLDTIMGILGVGDDDKPAPVQGPPMPSGYAASHRSPHHYTGNGYAGVGPTGSTPHARTDPSALGSWAQDRYRGPSGHTGRNVIEVAGGKDWSSTLASDHDDQLDSGFSPNFHPSWGDFLGGFGGGDHKPDRLEYQKGYNRTGGEYDPVKQGGLDKFLHSDYGWQQKMLQDEKDWKGDHPAGAWASENLFNVLSGFAGGPKGMMGAPKGKPYVNNPVMPFNGNTRAPHQKLPNMNPNGQRPQRKVYTGQHSRPEGYEPFDIRKNLMEVLGFNNNTTAAGRASTARETPTAISRKIARRDHVDEQALQQKMYEDGIRKEFGIPEGQPLPKSFRDTQQHGPYKSFEDWFKTPGSADEVDGPFSDGSWQQMSWDF